MEVEEDLDRRGIKSESVFAFHSAIRHFASCKYSTHGFFPLPSAISDCFIIMYGTLLIVGSSLAGLAASASTNTDLQTVFPTATETTHLSAVRTIAAGETFDGEMKQWDRKRKTQNTLSISA